MNPHYGKTRVIVCRNNQTLGQQAAAAVAACLRELARTRPVVRAVFAAGESQSTFLGALAREPNLPWERVDCFNVDDFWDPRLTRLAATARPIESLPASILRDKDGRLFVDEDSCPDGWAS